MAKIIVIDVAIGDNVEDIINDDVKLLTDKNQKEIDNAIAEQVAKNTAKTTKLSSAKLQEQRIDEMLEKLYNTMVDNHARDIKTDLDDMMKIADPLIASSAGLIIRLKGHIKLKHGNKFVIKKCKSQGKTCYSLIEYNT